MKILAIDPGITTAYALIDSEDLSQPLIWGERGFIRIAKLEELQGRYDVVLIERTLSPTSSQMNKKLSTVISILMRLFPDNIIVWPSTWKSHPIAKRRLPHLYYKIYKPSQHMKDAMRMALHYVEVNDV